MSDEEFLSRIRAEIDKTGFPLELRIAEQLRQRQYHVASSLYYVDRDEGKGREIDVRALRNYSWPEDHQHWVRHCLLIECKRSADKPWVIFTSHHTPYDLKPANIPKSGLKGLFPWPQFAERLQLDSIHPFAAYERRGRSFFEPFKGGEVNETIYRSLISVVKATIECRNSGFGAHGSSICFYYPVVVFDGKLIEAYLDGDSMVVHEVTSLLVSFHYESPNYRQEQFAVAVVNPTAFESLCASLDVILDRLGAELTRDPSAFA